MNKYSHGVGTTVFIFLIPPKVITISDILKFSFFFDTLLKFDYLNTLI